MMPEGDNFSQIVGSNFEKSSRSRGLSSNPNVPVPVDGTAAVVEMGAGTGVKQWAEHGGVYWGVSGSHARIPAGVYRTAITPNQGPVLISVRVDTDTLINLPDSAIDDIIGQFHHFWNRAAEFKSRGFLHKRGFMLWGPPGSGKTSCLMMMAKRLVSDLNGVVLIGDAPGPLSLCLQMTRNVEPDRPVVVILEDFDSLLRRYDESEYLSILDGEMQVDNVVYVATTNYPENIDPRFVDRPSRFDVIQYIGMPNADSRRVYLRSREESLAGEELEYWVARSQGFSVAHLKEMVVANRCLGQPIDTVIERLSEMHERRPTSDDSEGKLRVGFTNFRHQGKLAT